MRYLKRQVLDNRAPADRRLTVDVSNGVTMGTTNNLLIPKGITTERPISPLLGMMRFNTTTNEVEVYQGLAEGNGVWRALRYKEAIGIIQQDLGVGDSIKTLFGPLNPAPPSVVQTGSTWTGANLIVIVENVIQIFTTNYVISVDPIGYTAGSYILFDQPPPIGKSVTVLHGFDK